MIYIHVFCITLIKNMQQCILPYLRAVKLKKKMERESCVPTFLDLYNNMQIIQFYCYNLYVSKI